MKLDESRFNTLADATLERIADIVDEVLGDRIDVESQGGIVTLTLNDGGQYVINKHGPNREIWMSSPASGAWHFAPADGAWISTREPRENLTILVARELGAKYGAALEL